MNRFEFNGLKPGDVVHLHHSMATEHRAEEGVVAFVHQKAKADNDVGIRVGAGEGREVLWPTRMGVHPEAIAPEGECWRCDEPLVSH
jgi:hypothetical protein